MKRPRRARMTAGEFRRFKNRMLQAKADERTRQLTADPVIYSDALLRVLLVVEHGGELWLVPRRPGGWASRSKVEMTPEARQERLRPARDVDATWLGIGGHNRKRGDETNIASGKANPAIRENQ